MINTRISSSHIKTLVLALFTITILTLHFSAMYDTYSTVKSIQTDSEIGSSLAERYLMFGDWPASKEHALGDYVSEFEINKNNKDEK